MITCKKCEAQFEVSGKELAFLNTMSPIFPSNSPKTGDNIKCSIPVPALCPLCRQKRRLQFRNERSLYRRKCDMTGKTLISIYNPETGYKVYCNQAFFGDNWNALDYGRDFDFSKSFTEQFDDLLHQVPHLSSVVVNSENCDYTSYCVDSKDCYMSQRLGNAERVHYSYLAVENCLDCIDCLQIVSCELCYEALDCEKCYYCSFIQDCQNCSSLKYCFDCVGCSDCFGSCNLRNQKFRFFNQPFSEDDYRSKVKEFEQKYSQEERFKKFEEFKLTQIHKESSNINNENAVGNRVHNSKNVDYGFDIDYVEDGVFLNGCEKGRDLMDGDFLFYGEQIYEQCSCSHSNNLLFSFVAFNSSNLLYCFNINSSHDLFGCANLRNCKYCILNKQYTKDEYEMLVPKIIDHMRETNEWGEFMDESLSPFEYSETVAAEYFPKKQSDLGTEALSDSSKKFRLIPQELEFYKRMDIETPTKHPNIRYHERLSRRNPRKLFDRNCDKCRKQIKTTYAPEKSEIVCCETCYLSEIY